jgi:hypothetical protein
VMSGAMMIGTTITAIAAMTTATGVVISKMTLGGGRATTTQSTTPSMPSSQGQA